MKSTMADLPIDDLNVASNETLITPDQLKREIPLTDAALHTVATGRQVIRDILEVKTIVYSWWSGPARFTTSKLPMKR
jgi:3-deoxy-7-phosphoheptulonate synthase